MAFITQHTVITVGSILGNYSALFLCLKKTFWNWLLIGKEKKKEASLSFTGFLPWTQYYARQFKYATLFNHEKNKLSCVSSQPALSISLLITSWVGSVKPQDLQYQLGILQFNSDIITWSLCRPQSVSAHFHKTGSPQIQKLTCQPYVQVVT